MPELAELFKVARATVYRTILRNQSATELAAQARLSASTPLTEPEEN